MSAHRSGRVLMVAAALVSASAAGVLLPVAVGQASASDTWSATGPFPKVSYGSGTVSTVADGSSGSASFDYYYCATGAPQGLSCYQFGLGLSAGVSWDFTSTAAAGETSVTDSYSWAGNHSYFDASAGLSAFVGSPSSATPIFQGRTVSGTFNFSGTHTFSDLSPGEAYGYVVSGANYDEYGFLEGSFTVSPSVSPSPPPVAPTGVSAFAANGQASLTWSEPTGPAGSSPTGYEVFEGTAPGAEGSTPVVSISGASTTSATVSGLADGTTYYFTVEAVNAAGSSSSAEVSATPDSATNLSWLEAQPVALNSTGSSASTGSTTQSLDAPGEALWYDVGIVPDEQLQVCLSNVPADYDVSLFSDIATTFSQELQSTPNLAELGAEAPGNAASPSAFSPSAFSPSAFSPSAFSPSAFSPSAFSPSAFSPSAFSPSAFSPSAFSPSAFSPSAFSPSAFSLAAFSPSAFSPSAFSPSAFSAGYAAAQTDSLLAVSTAPGPVDKCATADTWNNTGDFYIRVTGNNGADAPGQAYTLTVTTSGSSCPSNLSSYSTDTTLSGSGSSPETVIVEDSARMPAVSTGALAAALQGLADRTDGVVVDVGQSQRVLHLSTQAQADVSCPYALNLEAGAIQDIVNSYRSPNLRYVVLVGDDDVIPFFRYPDSAGLAPESGYAPPLSSTSPPGAALASDDYLSDDQYGAASELSYEGTTIPLATAAVGRLVETPADILATLDSYLGTGTSPGVTSITPKSSLVTGYDFMTPPADAVESAFTSGGLGNDTLINPVGTPAANSWTATDLAGSLFGTHHDLVFLGGHFSANNLLAADDSTTMTTNQFAAQVGTSLSNSLVLAAGCHAGYNIDPADAVPGVTDPLAWPQAFTEAGATLIAGTGYQYGDTNYTAYSDQVYVDLAQQLGQTPGAGTSASFSTLSGAVGDPGAVAVGAALLAAKQEYLAGLDQVNGIEEKALFEITLYGLPMLGLHEPTQGVAASAAASAVRPNPIVSGPGSPSNLGLSEAQLSLAPTVSTNQVQSGSTSYTYDSGPQGVVADPAGPVLPLQLYDVNVPGATMRGVGLWSASYTDTPGLSELTGDPATDTGNPAVVPFVSPTLFPQTVWNPNYLPTLIDGGDTELAVTPEQYVSDPGSSTTDTQRRYTKLGLNLFYSANTAKYAVSTTDPATGQATSYTNIPYLAAAPTISGVTSTVSGDTVTVSATVTGDPGAGIQEVWVTYTGTQPGDPLYGQWQSVDLTQGASGGQWTGTFTDTDAAGATGSPSADSRFIVQAVNGVGEVSMDDNNGYYFTPSTTPGAPAAPFANTYSLTLGGPTSGAYQGQADVTATLAVASASSAPGVPAPQVSGQSVTFGFDGTTLEATTDASGVATVAVPLIETPGSYELSASYAGNATDQAAGTSEPFQVTPAPTALQLSAPAQLTAGTTSDVSATLASGGAPLAQEPVYFEVEPATTGSSPPPPVLTTSAVTNSSGVARPGPLQIPAGDIGAYTLTAVFGSSSVPLADGSVYDASEPDYSSSTATAAVDVSDPPPSVAISAPSTVTATGPLTPVTYTVSATAYGGATIPTSCTVASGVPVAVDTVVTISCSATDLYGDVGSASASVEVVPAPLTISLSGSQTYGHGASFSYTATGFVNGDTALTGTLSCSSTASPASPVGSYPITPGSCSGLTIPSYYAPSYVYGSVKVTPAPLTIIASSGTSTFGSTPPQVTPIYDGLVNGATPASLTDEPTCGTATVLTSLSPAGSYPTSCSGAADPNYTISYTGGEIVIGKQVLLVIASSASMTYGGSQPPVSASYSGFVNGDTSATISQQPTCTVSGPSPLTVGTWTTSCTGAVDSNPNYTVVVVPGKLEVDPAPLTVTASSPTVTYGQAPPAITPSYSGFVDGDVAASLATAPTCTTAATGSSQPGTYPTSCSGASDPNYSVNYVGGVLTVTPSTLVLIGSASGALAMSGQATATVQGSLDLDAPVNGSAGLSGQADLSVTGTLLSPAAHPVTASGQAVVSAGSQQTLAAENDPYAALPAPSTGGMAVYTSSTIEGPGVYTHAVSLTGSSTAQLASGVYVFEAGLSLSGQASITSATGGVLVYLAGGALSLSGQASLALAPLGSGTYSGIGLVEPAGDGQAVSLSGQATLLLGGAVDAPAATLQLSGQAKLASAAGSVAAGLGLTGHAVATFG